MSNRIAPGMKPKTGRIDGLTSKTIAEPNRAMNDAAPNCPVAHMTRMITKKIIML